MQTDPVVLLRRIVNEKKKSYENYAQYHRDRDLTRWEDELMKLDDICSKIETATRFFPISLVERINKGVIEARQNEFEGNCVQIWLPLKNNVDIYNARPVICDLVPFDTVAASDYYHIGFLSGKLYQALKEREVHNE